jgi:hypothetical protein
MTILRALLSTETVRTPIEFGIQENIRLVSIDNTERVREGEPVKKNTFLTFVQYNDKNEKIASSEFSYFNLDETSNFVKDNLITQLGQLNKLVSIYKDREDLIDPLVEFESLSELDDALRTARGCKRIMQKMWEEFSAHIAEHIGENSKLLRVKIITDSKGKYLQLPREIHFAEPVEQECSLNITAYEMNLRQKGLQQTTVKPDNTTDTAPSRPPITSI